MIAQAVPIGININSPVTWLVVAVACIVLALTLSTRRANSGPRAGLTAVPEPPQRLTPHWRERYIQDWTAAQALFLDDPRAGLQRAQAIVASALTERNDAASNATTNQRYRDACAAADKGDASTEELRRAFLSLRSVLDDLGSAGNT